MTALLMALWGVSVALMASLGYEASTSILVGSLLVLWLMCLHKGIRAG